jgi:hypothetical protein
MNLSTISLPLVGKANKIAKVTYQKCGYGHLKSFGENVQPHCLVFSPLGFPSDFWMINFMPSHPSICQWDEIFNRGMPKNSTKSLGVPIRALDD